jgi:hypothetical protein
MSPAPLASRQRRRSPAASAPESYACETPRHWVSESGDLPLVELNAGHNTIEGRDQEAFRFIRIRRRGTYSRWRQAQHRIGYWRISKCERSLHLRWEKRRSEEKQYGQPIGILVSWIAKIGEKNQPQSDLDANLPIRRRIFRLLDFGRGRWMFSSRLRSGDKPGICR